MTEELPMVTSGATGRETEPIQASRCVRCGDVRFPPRTPCPACWADVVNVPLTSAARLETYTIVHRGPERIPGPYAVGFGAFPEGVRVFAPIVTDHAEALRIGQRLTLTVGEPESWPPFAFTPLPEE